MIPLRLYVENIAGDWFGWVDGYPGAFSRNGTAEGAVGTMPRAFASHVQWLRGHGLPVPPEVDSAGAFEFAPQVVRVCEGITPAPDEARHEMPGDRAPLGPDAFGGMLRLLGCARADVMAMAAEIPPFDWDTAPFGGASIRSLLERLCESDSAMLRRIGGDPVSALSDPLETLTRTREAFEAAVAAAFNEGERTKTRAARWPLAKALRIAAWHDRYIWSQLADRKDPAAYMRAFRRGDAIVRGRYGEAPMSHRESEEKVLAATQPRVGEHTYYY
ncbi:MAG TPA: hypothetical protein VKT77_02820 [Chthonomonadaceae bacterium]|nr:hypothetical protein [Chthonomonadaceae bacterium]